MPDRDFPRSDYALAQRWRDLADRRRLHIVELYRSGRWRHYYTEHELVAGLREAIADVERWDAIIRATPAIAAEPSISEPSSAAGEQPPLQILLGIVREKDEAAPVPQPDAA